MTKLNRCHGFVNFQRVNREQYVTSCGSDDLSELRNPIFPLTIPTETHPYNDSGTVTIPRFTQSLRPTARAVRGRHRPVVSTADADVDRCFGVDDQLGACAGSIHIVAKDRDTTGPFPFSALGSDFVADPLANDLSLELGKREQDVQRQPAHRVGRIELLGYRDEGNTIFIEGFHDPGEVHERAAKSIDFVDHHAIDLSAFDVFEESIEIRSIEATARETTVVVLLRQALGERH